MAYECEEECEESINPRDAEGMRVLALAEFEQTGDRSSVGGIVRDAERRGWLKTEPKKPEPPKLTSRYEGNDLKLQHQQWRDDYGF